MNIQVDSLFHKTIEHLFNDPNIENNILGYLMGANVQSEVHNYLFKEFQKNTPTMSIQDYNRFVDAFNKCVDDFSKINESKNKTEDKNSKSELQKKREFLLFLFLHEMKLFKFYQHSFPMIDSHQVETLWNVAIISYLLLSNVIKASPEDRIKRINVLDLTKFIPEPFGYDLVYEVQSGLILRYISDFKKENPSLFSKVDLSGTAQITDDLTNYICKTTYPEIQWLSPSTQVSDSLQELYNAVIINTQNISLPGYCHFKEDGEAYTIDFSKYVDQLEKAIDLTDQNHYIITILPVSIISKEKVPSLVVSAYSELETEEEVYVLRPKAKEWEQLYMLHSRYGLKLNSIICVDTTFSSPACPCENEPGMCVLFLSAESETKYDKVLLAEVENGISPEELQNIVSREKKVTIGTWNDTTTVLYLDQDTHFYGSINDAYLRQCNKDKKTKLKNDGFKTYMGRDLLQRVEKYIPQYYDEDFHEISSSIFIPASEKIFKEIECIGYNFEDYYNTIRKHAFPLIMFDLSRIPWYQFILKKCEHDHEMVKLLDNDRHKTNLGYDFDFDFQKFGLQLEKDKIVCGDQVIQEFTLTSRFTDLEDLIVRQIVKANTYQLILNQGLVTIQYLKLLSGTEINSELLNKWFVSCQDMDTAESFKTLEFTLPSIENQRKIVKYDNHLNLGKIEIEKKKSDLRNYLGGTFDDFESTYLSADNFNFELEPYKVNELQQLPQPIASLLYLDQCENNISRKNANLLHLFEAVANFHAVVCLSILKSINTPECKSIVGSLVKNNLLYNSKNKTSTIRFTFGTWTMLLVHFISKIKNKNIQYFDITTNNELNDELQTTKELRNEKSAHAPRMSEITEEELNSELSNHCDKIINALLKIYGRYSLIAGPYQVVERAEDGSRVISCFKAMGNTPRFVNQKVRVYGNTDFLDHIIYLLPRTFHSVPIPILPFFSYMPLCEKDYKLQSLGYIHEIKIYNDSDEEDTREITWYSYDCGDNNMKTTHYYDDKSTKDLIDWLEPYWKKKFQIPS